MASYCQTQASIAAKKLAEEQSGTACAVGRVIGFGIDAATGGQTYGAGTIFGCQVGETIRYYTLSEMDQKSVREEYYSALRACQVEAGETPTPFLPAPNPIRRREMGISY